MLYSWYIHTLLFLIDRISRLITWCHSAGEVWPPSTFYRGRVVHGTSVQFSFIFLYFFETVQHRLPQHITVTDCSVCSCLKAKPLPKLHANSSTNFQYTLAHGKTWSTSLPLRLAYQTVIPNNHIEISNIYCISKKTLDCGHNFGKIMLTNFQNFFTEKFSRNLSMYPRW